MVEGIFQDVPFKKAIVLMEISRKREFKGGLYD